MESSLLAINEIECQSLHELNRVALSELGSTHQLSRKSIAGLERLFNLKSIVMNDASHTKMLDECLSRLLKKHSELTSYKGILIYAKTQTHNTIFGDDWLNTLKVNKNLASWEHMTLSLNHCASGLSAFHFVNKSSLLKQDTPCIIICGEKSFHPSISKISTAALGELASACLLNFGNSKWVVTYTNVFHATQFYKNQNEMTSTEKREQSNYFYRGLKCFLHSSISDSGTKPDNIDLIVPYNLNLPLLKRISNEFMWKNKMDTKNISIIGHTFCSDIFFNLSQVFLNKNFKRLLVFSAGLGITFSCIIIERK